MTRIQIHKLMEDGTYRGMSLQGELIETHISWVILTQSFAFKIKKPIQYSFLDFSSLEKRKFYCEEELKLNQRLSDVYLDVLPIKLINGHLHLGPGEGEIIDYAVQMSRLKTAKKMDNLLLKNGVTQEHIKALAEKIAHFHERAKVVKTPFNKSHLKSAFNDLLSVRDWTEEHLGKDYATMIEKAIAFSDAFLDKHEAIMTSRIEQGFQRDMHGDLHSKNIFLYHEPIIFDCIEFNETFRQIDILNELAFFCMDLEAFKQEELSSAFMEIYAALFPCIRSQEEQALFIYYKCYRANVRAKVNAFRAIQTTEKHILEQYALETKKYLELMDGYVNNIPSLPQASKGKIQD